MADTYEMCCERAELAAKAAVNATVDNVLDRELRAEIARRWPDGFRIQKLKRLKLAVKDRLQNYARAIRADKAQ